MARAETSEKSAAAFRTISEAADTIGVPQHVLRFWETRFPQLQPLKRGGNRRYYRPADMALLETIRSMLHDRGLTIRGARLALAETGEAAAVPPRAPARILRAVTTDTPGVEAQHPDTPVAPEPVRPAASLRAPVDLAPLRIIRDRLARALAA